jgi:acyl dehydratase
MITGTRSGVVDQRLVEEIREHRGIETIRELGLVTAIMIKRYAVSIGADDPLYFDEEHARSKGFRSVVAPLNFLPSIVDWTQGAAESDLRVDGTSFGETNRGIPAAGYRLMGGGERMEFHERLQAGDEVGCRSTLDAADLQDTRSGHVAIVKYRNRYETTSGQPIMTCVRSVLVRNGA